MTQTPNETPLDRATDPEYAAISSAAVIGLIIAILGVWPLLLISHYWIEPPSSVPDLMVHLAVFWQLRSWGCSSGRLPIGRSVGPTGC